MDPNKALEEVKRLASQIAMREDDGSVPTSKEDLSPYDLDALFSQAQDAAVLVAHLQGLTEWIEKGGFLPTAWRKS